AGGDRLCMLSIGTASRCPRRKNLVGAPPPRHPSARCAPRAGRPDPVWIDSSDRVDLPAVRRERNGWRGGGAPAGTFFSAGTGKRCPWSACRKGLHPQTRTPKKKSQRG